MNTTQALASRGLNSEEIDQVSGGSPIVVGRAVAAIAGYLGGKIIDGIVDSSGILSPAIRFGKGGKVIIGGK